MAHLMQNGDTVQPARPNGRAPRHRDPDDSLLDRLRPYFAHEHAPLVILIGLVAIWVLVMGSLIVLRHQRFGTFDFDEGIYDQYLWQLAHGRGSNTVRGVPLAGHHASFAFLLIAPLAWLGAGPNTWNLLMTLALGATAIPLYLLARDKLHRSWLALLVGVVWLLQPTVSWLVQEGFHPDGMAVPFLVCTYLFGERLIRQREAHRVRRSTRWAFVASFLLTITWKEDLALALVGMGLVWAIRRHWRFAAQVIGVAAVWFLLFGVWLVPHFAGGSVYGGIYGDLGATPSEIAVNSAKHPSRLVERLDDNDAIGYTRGLTESWGFVPILAPATLLITAPQWFTNIISSAGFTYDLHFHYQSVPMAALAISFVEGLRRLIRWRRWVGEGVAIVGLVAAFACASWYGATPLSVKYDQGAWPLVDPVDFAAKQHAVALVRGGKGVSADYLMVSHLTHRQVAYSFPNPWVSRNYGVGHGQTGDPAEVHWLVVDTAVLGDADRSLLASISGSGEFAVRYDSGHVLVLERVKPPGEGTHQIVLPDP